MSTDKENQPTTKSKRKHKSSKPLCTFPKCGPVKAYEKHVKKLTEENAILKQELAKRDARIEEMQAELCSLRGDLFAPSSEKLHLTAKDGILTKNVAVASGGVETDDGLRKRGAQLGHRGNGYAPVILETFVEKQRFPGTCYKAANWYHVGETQGRGKLDRKYECKLPVKDIYLYPLCKNFRELLTQPD